MKQLNAKIKKVFFLIAVVIFSLPVFAQSDITLLFTTDNHSNLVPIRNADGNYVGGFARLKTAVDSYRIDGQTLLLDAGDYSMGTLFQTSLGSEALELRLMYDLGYDAIAIGNHEFDYGDDTFRQSLQTARSYNKLPPVLGSNIIHADKTRQPSDFSVQNADHPLVEYGVNNYIIRTVNGIRIGIFSILGYDAANYFFSKEYALYDYIKATQAYVTHLRSVEKADMVILLSHEGTKHRPKARADEELAKKVPGIDVIISGHQHFEIETPYVIGNTTIVGSGTAVQNLGVITLSKTADSWRDTKNSHRLVKLDSSVPSDPGITATLEDFLADIDKTYLSKYGVTDSYNEVIAFTPFTFPTVQQAEDSDGDHSLGNIIADSYLDALNRLQPSDKKIRLAIVPLGFIRQRLVKGEIKPTDVYNILSFGASPADRQSGCPLMWSYVTGKDVWNAAEVDASIGPMMSSAKLSFAGVKIVSDAKRLIFNRVISVEVFDAEQNTYVPVDRDDTLYTAGFTWNAADALALVGKKSFSILSITPRDENGKPLDTVALQNRIMTIDVAGQSRELKDWKALYDYIRVFPPADFYGTMLPRVPEQYAGPDGRKTIVAQTVFQRYFTGLNAFAIAVYAVVLLILTLIVLTVAVLLRVVKRRRQNKSQH